MSLFKSINKRYNWLVKVSFDRKTGFYRYKRFGHNIYIRQPRHYLKERDILWTCENLFYKHYLPVKGDVVLDLGAGYGEESTYIAEHTSGVKYIGVEAQPVIYECLANTYHDLGDNFVASPYVITDAESVKFVSHYSYASVGEIPEGYIDVPTIRWDDFLKKYAIDRIDLLKMNIEGAEKDIMQSITDFSMVRRFAISCHDFRANNNEGEWFRTKDIVMKALQDNGYKIRTFSYGINWADDWIYAER
jgi:FkbM family methyltransferase